MRLTFILFTFLLSTARVFAAPVDSLAQVKNFCIKTPSMSKFYDLLVPIAKPYTHDLRLPASTKYSIYYDFLNSLIFSYWEILSALVSGYEHPGLIAQEKTDSDILLDIWGNSSFTALNFVTAVFSNTHYSSLICSDDDVHCTRRALYYIYNERMRSPYFHEASQDSASSERRERDKRLGTHKLGFFLNGNQSFLEETLVQFQHDPENATFRIYEELFARYNSILPHAHKQWFKYLQRQGSVCDCFTIHLDRHCDTCQCSIRRFIPREPKLEDIRQQLQDTNEVANFFLAFTTVIRDFQAAYSSEKDMDQDLLAILTNWLAPNGERYILDDRNYEYFNSRLLDILFSVHDTWFDYEGAIGNWTFNNVEDFCNALFKTSSAGQH